MANDTQLTQGDGSGGTAAMDEKPFLSVTKKFQRVTLAAGDTLAVSTISQSTTGVVVIPAAEGRVYAQVYPVDGDIYLAASTSGLGTDATRRKVRAGVPWDTHEYVGDIAIKAVTGFVTVELEQVT